MQRILIVILILFTLSSCQQESRSEADLHVKIAEMQDQINQLNLRLSFMQNGFAAFSPDSKGYEMLNANVGTFIVALKNISEYANGYKVTFNIGNPSLMTFNGVQATVSWGQPYIKGEDFNNWLNSLKSEQIKLTQSILPGVWNKVTFVLSPAKAEDTGFISLSLHTDEILLYNDYRKTN